MLTARLSTGRPTDRSVFATCCLQVWRVTGCLVKYFDNPYQNLPAYNVTSRVDRINGNLPIRYFELNDIAELQ